MRTIDARGHRCPTPTLKLGRALREAAPGDEIELLATDPMARIDVPHFLAQTGHELISTEERDGVLAFRVTRSASAPTG
ncbi:sulfurtransferase TusA family protein [Brevundimonas sp.]|uniref:sulfurtransferase TusA family protein n=1 Tax=Brevundimonas sp. TaxID=1871086 RepID=UPI0025D372E7|nr:sulfurtransferase TusA family protein [Brevundimonas sp.]